MNKYAYYFSIPTDNSKSLLMKWNKEKGTSYEIQIAAKSKLDWFWAVVN